MKRILGIMCCLVVATGTGCRSRSEWPIAIYTNGYEALYGGYAALARHLVWDVDPPLDAIVAQDGELVIATLRRGNDQHLYSLNMSTDAWRQRTNEHGFAHDPVFGPDGRHIYYIHTERGGRSDVRAVDLDTADVRSITDYGSAVFDPIVGDGALVCGVGYGRQYGGLRIFRLGDGANQRVTYGKFQDRFPKVLPEPDEIVFLRGHTLTRFWPKDKKTWTDFDFFVYDSNTRNVRRLTTFALKSVADVQYSASGNVALLRDYVGHWRVWRRTEPAELPYVSPRGVTVSPSQDFVHARESLPDAKLSEDGATLYFVHQEWATEAGRTSIIAYAINGERELNQQELTVRELNLPAGVLPARIFLVHDVRTNERLALIVNREENGAY